GKWRSGGAVEGLNSFRDALGAAGRMQALGMHGIVHPNSLLGNHLRPQERDRHCFYWKNDRPHIYSTTHEFVCVEFRHQVEPEVFELFVYVDPQFDPSGGVITCRLTASNLSQPAVIRVPIAIAYETASALNAVKRLVGCR